MKRFNKKNFIFLIALVFIVLGLTACDFDGSMYRKPLNDFGDETNLFGWLLLYPIGWLMHLIGNIFPYGSGQFAFGLVFTTLIVRTLAWPIYAKTNDMSLKMSLAQPEMQKVQAKYANRKDPQSQQRMQQEMMAIYRKYKISFTSCLMPFIQMPIFMAMYTVVKRIVIPTGKLALTDVSFFGIENCLNLGVLMAGETKVNGEKISLTAETWSAAWWVGIVLAILVGVSMWYLNHLSQKKPKYQKTIPSKTQEQNPMGSSMKVMNVMMIVMMVFASLSNNGLALYWVIGNIYAIVQNIISRKLNEIKYEKMKSEIDILI